MSQGQSKEYRPKQPMVDTSTKWHEEKGNKKAYDKFKNDRKNELIEKLYKKHQKEYKKQKRKSKIIYEKLENETILDEEAMAKKIKKLNNQHTTQSNHSKIR